MEIFDKIGKKASEAYKITADKTGKLAKEAKIKLKIGELKSQINDVYDEIGKRVYEKHIRENDENADQEIEEKCVKIDVLSDEIESLLKECLELKDKRQCPNCHAEIGKDGSFCKYCGEKQEEPAKEVEIVEVEVVETVEVSNQQESEENVESKDEEDTTTNLEETVAVESNVEIERENTEQENENLEKTVEVESNIE